MKQKRSKKSNNSPLPVLAAVLTVAVLLIAVRFAGDKSRPQQPEESAPGNPEISEAVEPAHSEPEIQVEFESFQAIDLGSGLSISDMGSYVGLYMEDGSDELVSDVMMIILRNDAQKDLQFARVELVFQDGTAVFELSNLPAGQAAVLLETERRPLPQGEVLGAVLRELAFFAEPMSLHEELFRVSGRDGVLTVENISGADIEGDIYIYYKNSADDLLYGGISYRVRISGGLAAGESAELAASHYRQGASRLSMISFGSE